MDHHCHTVTLADLDRTGFEALISEGGAPPSGTTNFDTPLGLAIRRHCAPVLDLEPHALPIEYMARRAELGAMEASRRLLSAAGTERFCVDVGIRPEQAASPAELAALASAPDVPVAAAHEIVRLESIAEALAADGVPAGEFAQRFAVALDGAITGRDAVGVKSVAAYRVGLDLDPEPPSPAEIVAAADQWLRRGPTPTSGWGHLPAVARGDDDAIGDDHAILARRWRLNDPTLTRLLLWCAVEHGLPIQVHIGLGDADLRMHRSDPTLLTDWLRRHRVPVMLLHCWPYQRQAGYLAAVHPHVYLDVGLALHYVGPTRAAAVLAEAAELAPFGKLLYSSDAYGVAELYHLGALAFRRALAAVLEAQVAAGEWAAADAVRIARLVSRENAVRVYRLPA